MRDQVVKLALFILLSLVASTAYARPHRKAPGSRMPSARAFRTVAQGRHSGLATPPRAPRSTTGKHRTRFAMTTQSSPETNLDVSALPPPQIDPQLADAQTTHNRKIHTKPGKTPAPDQKPDSVSPQKASSADFLAVPVAVSVTLPKPGEAPEAPTVKKARLPKQIFPVISVAPDPVPVLMPALYTRRGRLIVPPALKGSHMILLRQNEMADREGLVRVQDDEHLLRLRGSKLLVAIPMNSGLAVDQRLPENRRYCRPWTAQFLTAIGRAHYARFHAPLQVNSAVRTVEVQERLLHTNGNAAPAEGVTASPHLTGQAVDIAKHGLSMAEIAWLRGYLLPLVGQGKVDVEEEFQQSCFHISVYKKYAPQLAPKRVIPLRHATAQVLAMALP